MPLEWIFAPGVVIEATDRTVGNALTRDDIQKRLPRELEERNIVLVHTGADANYGGADYSMPGPRVTAEAMPPFGFHVACFPLRVTGASAAPARVIALVHDESEAAVGPR